MQPHKTLRPDGMPPLFFQKYWHIVGDSIICTVAHCLNTDYVPVERNCTYLMLIPKKNHPKFLSDCRPISLCNVVYRIIARVLANRLKLILPIVVSPTQTTFIPGHLITDNKLVAFETVHAIHMRKRG